MARSILELQTGIGATARGRLVQAVRSSWRAIGASGRIVSVGAAVSILTVTAWWVPSSWSALATGSALLVLAVAAVVDAATHRLPDLLVGLAAVPVVAAVVVGVVDRGGGLLPAALLGAAFVAGPLLATHLVSPAGMGFGDVKAGAVLGAALGLLAPPLALLALVVGLLVAAVVGLVRRLRNIPLGPALVAGAVVALVLGRLAGLEAVVP